MKIKVSIVSQNTLLEKTLEKLPELSNFQFSTNIEFISGTADFYLVTSEIPEIVNESSLLLMKKPVDVNYIICFLSEFAKDRSKKISTINFNHRQRQLSEKHIIIHLTEIEANLLEGIVNSKDMTTSKAELTQNILGYSKDAETRTLENHLYKLKTKLKEFGKEEILKIEGDKVSIDSN